MSPTVEFIQALVSGISIGCIYALVALGFVLIYKATEVINFAQGELMMVGAFFAFTFVDLGGMPFVVGVLLALAATALFGMLVNVLLLRRLVGRSSFTIVLATVGLGTLLRALASMVPGWGADTHALSNPMTGKTVTLSGVTVSWEHIAVVVATIGLVALLYLFFRFTRLGVALQATSQNQLAAGYVGIPIKAMFSAAWGIGAGVACVAGILLAPSHFVHVNMGFVGLKAFPAAVIGGFGSIPGAILGGLIIGVAEELAGLYLPEGFKNVAAYIVMLALLMVRPQGLFGVDLRERA
jgi:branched-chain amino acid transport system permease protein